MLSPESGQSEWNKGKVSKVSLGKSAKGENVQLGPPICSPRLMWSRRGCCRPGPAGRSWAASPSFAARLGATPEMKSRPYPLYGLRWLVGCSKNQKVASHALAGRRRRRTPPGKRRLCGSCVTFRRRCVCVRSASIQAGIIDGEGKIEIPV